MSIGTDHAYMCNHQWVDFHDADTSQVNMSWFVSSALIMRRQYKYIHCITASMGSHQWVDLRDADNSQVNISWFG